MPPGGGHGTDRDNAERVIHRPGWGGRRPDRCRRCVSVPEQWGGRPRARRSRGLTAGGAVVRETLASGRIWNVTPRPRWRERVVAHGRVRPAPTCSAAPVIPGPDGKGEPSPPRGWTWAALMHRAFEVDVLAHPHRRRPPAADRHAAPSPVIRKILAHLRRAPRGIRADPAVALAG